MTTKKRPVAIDCANVACGYLYNSNHVGDSRGPVEAYRYWIREGHPVKVFVKQYRITNRNQDEIMENIDEFLGNIPTSDRPVVPSDGDDDSYFIKWALENDAILISNDLLRDHSQRLKGEDLSRFEKWLPRSRCGFTFIDDEFFPDPNFGIEESTTPIGPSESTQSEVLEPKSAEESKSLENLKKTDLSKKKRIEIDSEELVEFGNMSREEQSLIISDIEEELPLLRIKRNELNNEVQGILSTRDFLNNETKDRIREVKTLKDKRDKHNDAVKKLKVARSPIDVKVKAARKSFKEGLISRSEYHKIRDSQRAAHEKVMREVNAAQDLHNAMTEISKIVEELRIEATENHELAMRKKKDADEFHIKYKEKLARKFAFDQIIRNGLNSGQEATEPVKDTPLQNTSLNPEDRLPLVKVVDGRNLVELADLVSNENQKDLSSELDGILSHVLSKYQSKTNRRQHMIDRVNHSYYVYGNTLEITSPKGWFLGILAQNKQAILDALKQKYGINASIVFKKSRIEQKEVPSSDPPPRMTEEALSGCTVKDLQMIAKERGLPGYSNLKKAELISLLKDRTTESMEIHDLTIDDVKLEKTAGEEILRKTENIDIEEFFRCLFSNIKESGEWSVLTTPYALMVAEKPEFRLHSMGVKLIDFLRLHSDRIELGQRKGHPWIREK